MSTTNVLKRSQPPNDNEQLSMSAAIRRRFSANVESTIDDLDEDTHTKLDGETLTMAARAGLKDPTSVAPFEAILLTLIVSCSEKLLDSTLANTQAALALCEKHPRIPDLLREAWKEQKFKSIRNLRILRSNVDQALPKRRWQDVNPIPLEPDRLNAAHKAWSDKWLGNSDCLLAELMDRLRTSAAADPKLKPYNHTIPLIQSSGMGKSRLMDSVARMKFCFPFNIRGPLPPHQFAYPPSDINVFDFFHDPTAADQITIERKYTVFFIALFECATQELRNALKTVEANCSIPQRWHAYLAMGATRDSVSPRRHSFYQKVIAKAGKLGKSTTDLVHLTTQLDLKGEEFVKHLRKQFQTSSHEDDHVLAEAPVQFFLYFDEAHVLAEPCSKSQVASLLLPPSKYHVLGRVLGKMNNLPFFSVFLSTNSWLGAFAPSSRKIPSLRDWTNTILHAPFTELPFDSFAEDAFGSLAQANSGHVKLQDVCSLDFIVKFGRPLWASLYECGNNNVKNEMVDFAKMKLSCGDAHNNYARIAALSVRVILDFDIARECARECEEKLVESYMRVAFTVPEHREFLRSGTPSEPLLAEAAAQLLNDTNALDEGPTVINEALCNGLLARGERGEMTSRLLWTLAHDAVIHERLGPTAQIQPSGQLHYHRPILLIDWLKALINSCWHNVVLNATPIAVPDGQPLWQAFKDVYLNFSHFARAGDMEAISSKYLCSALVRHMAYQCCDNQQSTDLVAPLHHGGLDTPICPENTTPLFGQIKNRKQRTEVLVNPHSAGKLDNSFPILSLVQDLGLPTSSVYSHHSLPAKELRPLNTADRTENIHIRHYQIHLEGCSHEVYRVIPVGMDNVYRAILGVMNVDQDFARSQYQDHRDALHRLKPAFYGSDPGPSFSWYHQPVSRTKARRNGQHPPAAVRGTKRKRMRKRRS